MDAHQIACIICDQGLRSLLERIGGGMAAGPRSRAPMAPNQGQQAPGRRGGGRAAGAANHPPAARGDRGMARRRRGQQGGRTGLTAGSRTHGGEYPRSRFCLQKIKARALCQSSNMIWKFPCHRYVKNIVDQLHSFGGGHSYRSGGHCLLQVQSAWSLRPRLRVWVIEKLSLLVNSGRMSRFAVSAPKANQALSPSHVLMLCETT